MKCRRIPLALALLVSAPGRAPAQGENPPPATQPSRETHMLDVGDPAPPWSAAEWLNGAPIQFADRKANPVLVLVFAATWSGPARDALAELDESQKRLAERGVRFIVVVDESAEAVNELIARRDAKLGLVVARDEQRRTTEAYCEAAAVGFVPYAFVVTPERRLAWHGHPRQPEMLDVVGQILAGKRDFDAWRSLVRRVRSVEQLEAGFRDAFAAQAWNSALLALEGLLQTDAPKPRLYRYKLSILLGELGRVDEAGRFVDALLAQHGHDATLLNGLAWDVVSDPRQFTQAPELGLRLAEAAYRAGGKASAEIADTYARALYVVGRVSDAAQVQERAVELSSKEGRERLERVLGFYRRCVELRNRPLVAP